MSVGSGGVQGERSTQRRPAISADGRFVAFAVERQQPGAGRHQRHLVDVFVRDRQTGTTERVSVGPGGVQGNGAAAYDPAISADGRFVAFDLGCHQPGAGRHQRPRRRVRPRPAGGHDRRVSVGPGGAQANGSSYDRVRSRRTGASSPSTRPPATWCRATPTVSDDVFVRDRKTGHDRAGERPAGRRRGERGQRLSRRSRRTGASSPSSRTASNLVPGDTNAADDVFVHDRQTGTTRG